MASVLSRRPCHILLLSYKQLKESVALRPHLKDCGRSEQQSVAAASVMLVTVTDKPGNLSV